MAFLIGVILLILFISFCYIKVKKTLKSYGINSLKETIEKAQFEDEETPKSLSSMDSIYLERINKDFPELNVNELKRMSEETILKCLNAIENKNSKDIKNKKLKAFVDSRIEDLKNKSISYDNIKIHKTVVSKYENSNGIATIYFGSSLEYFYQKDGGIKKKVQDRFKVEYIYVYDIDKVPINQKVLGLNCPNCGSPIKTLNEKNCEYCGSKILDIVKKSWTCNDIINY